MLSWLVSWRVKIIVHRLIYTLLYYVLTPVMLIRVIIKHFKSRAYKNERQSLRLAERLGFFRAPDFLEPPIWLHTVSVGEFLATLPLIEKLQQQYPQIPLVVTTTTTTGSAQVKKKLGDKVFHMYLPYDLPGSVARFYKKIAPRIGLVMETEIWPNLFNRASQLDIPVWLLNARMSERSARGYARFAALSRQTLQKLSGIAVQNQLDADRLLLLGASKDRLFITGSIKYDLIISQQAVLKGHQFRNQLHWQDKTVLIAASTHQGEDEIILELFHQLKQQHTNMVLIMVPRHPERFQQVYQLITNYSFVTVKRTRIAAQNNQYVEVLLGDSMGEMISYFACADIVFMGGTMVATGGHNILEPAALGLPIVYGPHMFNFQVISELFRQHHAVMQVKGRQELKQQIQYLLNDPQYRSELGNKAKRLMQENSGALDKMLGLIKSDI